MIDENVLDQILPVPDRDELKNSVQAELEEEGFTITNFSSGGIWYTLLMIAIQIRIDILQMLRTVLSNMFVSHADENWLELKAADYSKKRKQPVKTQGYVSLQRSQGGTVVRIAKGDIFRTRSDLLGEELRFLAVSNSIMPSDAISFRVLVEAEKEGADYNVPNGQITRSLTHIEGIDSITNEEDWIIREGSDLEDIESLRTRTLNSWAELSAQPIADKYKNICEAIPGVLFVRVDDLHPRGQGTIDIVVTGTAGVPSEGLLEQVRQAAEAIKGPDDNLLVKASDTVEQDVAVTIWIPAAASEEGLEEQAMATVTDLLRIRKGRDLNVLNQADIIYALRKDISIAKNVRVTLPVTDVELDNDKVIVMGDIAVTIIRG